MKGEVVYVLVVVLSFEGVRGSEPELDGTMGLYMSHGLAFLGRPPTDESEPFCAL